MVTTERGGAAPGRKEVMAQCRPPPCSWERAGLCELPGSLEDVFIFSLLFRMFTAVLCGLPATALAFEFGGQLALGRGYPRWPPATSGAHGHVLVSLSSCQVCRVCVWGWNRLGNYLGDGNTGHVFE